MPTTLKTMTTPKTTFTEADRAWNALEPFRAERRRCKRYVYGDQWDDAITVNGQTMRERDFIISQGQTPMKNNILRRILRNVTGIYRERCRVPKVKLSDLRTRKEELRKINASRTAWFKANRMDEFAPRLFEEFLISGLVAVRIDEAEGERTILPVTPDNFFFHSDGYDPRGWNVDLVGEVHNVAFDAIMERFGKSPERRSALVAAYGEMARAGYPCRLVEVWHKEMQLFDVAIDRERGRMGVASAALMQTPDAGEERKTLVRRGWKQTIYASDGTMLLEGDLTERHPYIFKVYPFLDGEIHSYISDLIDQQRYVNRLIMLYDFVMKSSAKGVLLFPDESLPRGVSLDEVAEEWSRFNGVIAYRAQPGVPMPTQVSGNAANIGITDLLKIEMQMLEDISGVSPTLQGKLASNATSGTLFSQQNEAAMTSLTDVVRSFDDFIAAIADAAPAARR